VTLDPDLEHDIAQQAALAPAHAQRLLDQLQEGSERLARGHHAPVVLCSPPVRAAVRRLIEVSMPRMAVMSFSEVLPEISIESLGSINAHQSRGLEPAVQQG
jgi:flagellar biosynthesis protein FlhA